MPNKPPSDRTRAAGVPPTHLTPGTVGAPSDHPKNTKRTQSATPTTKKCETNPIPPGKQPIANSQKLLFTKRTQFTHTATCPTPKKRNEPNFSLPSIPPPPIYAKRTQSQPRRTCGGQKNETNPIYRTGAACRVPIMQNEPNLPTRPPGQQPKNAKRTQFRANHAGLRTKAEYFPKL